MSRRNVSIGVVILAAAGLGLYFWMEYDPDAPRSDWPILEAAAPATELAHVHVGRNVHVSASLKKFQYLECVIAADLKEPSRDE